ncbi:hypothetical protein BX661DRAFT_183651, partial [Kickxella alabastrina]|uniref:uncharacterized protein n=1 Tax=Kickxella alabastrina TaxID=61397 RepID=UPI00221FA409
RSSRIPRMGLLLSMGIPMKSGVPVNGSLATSTCPTVVALNPHCSATSMCLSWVGSVSLAASSAVPQPMTLAQPQSMTYTLLFLTHTFPG